MAGLKLPDHLADGVVPAADGTEVSHRFYMETCGVSHGNRVFVRIQANKHCAMFFVEQLPEFKHLNA